MKAQAALDVALARMTKAEDKHRRLLVRRNAAEERLWAAQERLWAAKMRFVAAKEQLEKE